MTKTFDIRAYASEGDIESGNFTVIADGMADKDQAMIRARLYLGVHYAVKVQGRGYIMMIRR